MVAGMHTNRLIEEKSPYLLQHAHNPVDWFPWGEEAFEKARSEDRPVFLSIGYATCHWCHVMERESFENEEIAALLNEAFVCIKVDREERPDIDAIYMTACQMMTGQGGWPLSIFMTPERRPFHAATYIPPEGRFGRLGMVELVPRIVQAWQSQRAKVLESAGQITEVLQKQQQAGGREQLDPSLLAQGYEELLSQYDKNKGGFGRAPRFPMPHRLVFLLRHGRPQGVAAAEHTLEAMRRGGIFDHVGFGFHRYSTDAEWLLPHFEKMLYDQALLALAYTEAYELTGKPFYAGVVRETLTYVERDMTAPEGGFYSAEDADAEGEEGRFHVWSTAELRDVLGSDFEWVAGLWNIRPEGNFNDESTGRATGKNIPHVSAWPDAETAQRLEVVRQQLFELREKRVHPLKDTKVLADWNGLMIAAFAKAGRVLHEPHFTEMADQAAGFIGARMRRADCTLWHRWREGDTAVPGHLEDYAFVIFGLLELYAATHDLRHLEAALEYNAILERLFVDEAGGGYFMTAADAEALIVRPKELYDGAIPSGNSVQLLNLIRLARLTGRQELEQRADETARAFGSAIRRSPSSFAQALTALQLAEGDSVEIVVVGERSDPRTQALLEHIRSVYMPGRVVLLKEPAEAGRLARIAPFTKEQGMVDGKPTVYLCRNFACERPINSLDELKARFN